MKKILVCGATGFIGRNIAEYFAAREEYEVHGVALNSPARAHPGIKMLRADLTDKNDVNEVTRGMDIIIQAAATTSGSQDIVNKPYYHVTDNAIMNSLIFRAAYDHEVSHVVFFSCSVMYQPGNEPVKEVDFDANQEIFPSYFGVGWSKVYCEKLCEFYTRISETNYTVIRHSNIYGPFDKYDLEKSHVFGATVTKVMQADEGGEIMVWGAGDEERDLLHVSDLVEFVNLALTKQTKHFELVNIGSGQAISVKDLVSMIIAGSGKRLTIAHDSSKPTIKTKLCLDITKASDTYAWSPQMTLDEGIQETLKWYAANYPVNAAK
ncbi:hypothetical protein D1AOALGA4SA_9697 [Olavius algarvensis Delta 1 endosymbiont]|nr:hypothetical protein D1AOALGA4SA_9697 [Olavius algarvensis Delta 1 endosymbiont]